MLDLVSAPVEMPIATGRVLVCEGAGVGALRCHAHRLCSRRVTLLVFLAEPPRRMGVLRRMLLRRADGVLVDGDATALALTGLGVACPLIRIAPDRPLGAFLGIAPDRPPHLARRMIAVGDLTPDSGAADLLALLIAWSEAHPARHLDLSWSGEGDLAGLLAAQPLPENLSQTFLGPLDPAQLAEAFAVSGLLVIPSITEAAGAPVLEALAAGLPVLGSRRNQEVRRLVTESVNGWLFDPVLPGAMSDAVSRALAADEQQLRALRLRARASVEVPGSGVLPGRACGDIGAGPSSMATAGGQAR